MQSEARDGRRRTRAYMNIHTQFENAGDALILRELIRLVSSRVPTDVYLGQAPDGFVQQLDLDGNNAVTAHRGQASVGLIRDIFKARLGGWRCYLFLTPGASNGERSRKQFAFDIIRLVSVAMTTLARVRICQVGVSFENIGARHARLLRWRSHLLYACAPREKLASDYARELGIQVTATMPDLSFNLFSLPPSPLEQLRRGIAFSFRVDKDRAMRDPLRQIVARVCKASTDQDELIFLAQVGRDVEFMRELAELAAEIRPGQVRFVDCHRNIEEAIATYATCRAVLSNRLHVLLPCLNEGAAPIALTTPELDQKISGIFDSIGLGERVFDIRTVDTDEIERWMVPADFDGRAVADSLNRFFDDLLGSPRDGQHPA